MNCGIFCHMETLNLCGPDPRPRWGTPGAQLPGATREGAWDADKRVAGASATKVHAASRQKRLTPQEKSRGPQEAAGPAGLGEETREGGVWLPWGGVGGVVEEGDWVGAGGGGVSRSGPPGGFGGEERREEWEERRRRAGEEGKKAGTCRLTPAQQRRQQKEEEAQASRPSAEAPQRGGHEPAGGTAE